MNKEVSNFCRDIIYLQKNQDIIEIYKLYSYNSQIFENYTSITYRFLLYLDFFVDK